VPIVERHDVLALLIGFMTFPAINTASPGRAHVQRALDGLAAILQNV